MIYHVVARPIWQYALPHGFYEPASLNSEGFIHASKVDQVKGVLERYYLGIPNLLLLHIDEDRVIPPVKYELSLVLNEEFPHIFGKLNTDAVVKVTAL